MLRILLTFYLIVNFCHGKLPSKIKVCSRNDENLDQCIINAVKHIQPLLAGGDLGDGYYTKNMEPFEYANISIDHGANFKAQVSNFKSNGGSNFTIEKLHFNYDTFNLDIIVKFPRLRLFGDYKLKLKLLVLEIAGDGEFDNIVTDSRMRMKLFGTKYMKNGQNYARFDKVLVRIQTGKSKINLKNLFNGDPTLGQIGNQVVNENQEILNDEFLPSLENQFAEVFKEVANKVIESATLDELFPEKL